MKSFLFGLGLGIGLGLLCAPLSGEDTRENLSQRATGSANAARESFAEGRERVRRGVEQAKATAGDALDPLRTGTGANI